jgi:hypothetical protein
MYHWRDVTISSGLSPFSKKFAIRSVLVGSPSRSPDARSPATTASRAENVVLPAMLLVRGAAVAVDPLGTSRRMRPSRPMTERVGSCSSRHHCTSVRSPKVQHIAMPAALVRLGGRVREHGDLDAEQRAGHRGAEQVLVALVVRVGDQRDAGRQQLGPGGLDVHGGAVGRAERDPVERAGVRARLELGLRHGGLERDVPEPGGLGLVRLVAGQVAQERLLGDGTRLGGDGLVGHAPVDGQAEPAPQRLELLLVLDGQRSHSSTKFRRLIGTWSAALTLLPSPPTCGGSKPSS